MNDTVHQYMNRIKIARHMTKVSNDTIQSNLNRIKMLEVDFCEKKRHF